jgi:hypothetical protein
MNSVNPLEMDLTTASQIALILAFLYTLGTFFVGVDYSTFCTQTNEIIYRMIQEFVKAFVINFAALTGLNSYVKKVNAKEVERVAKSAS